MLETLDFEDSVIDRVCYLIAHHHTYTDINGLDYQILVEADFSGKPIRKEMSQGKRPDRSCGASFAPESGRQICADMFGLSLDPEATRE